MTLEYRGELVVSAMIEDRADRLGSRVAFATPTGSLTHEQVADRAARFAAYLHELGVGAGDRVATMMLPSLDYVVAWFGTSWAGAVEVPVNTDHVGTFLHHALRLTGARVLVTEARFVARLEGLDLPDLEHVVVVGDEYLSMAPAPRARRRPDDLAYIIFTSGTTGPSKGVMQPNATALLGNVIPWVRLLDLTSDDVAYSPFPLFHVTARNAICSSALFAGGSVALRPGLSISGFWEDTVSAGATYLCYMGALVHLLWKQPPGPLDRAHRFRAWWGAAAPPAIKEGFEERFGFPLIEVYGGSELGAATATRPGAEPGVMGRPFPHHQIEVHDEADLPCPPGTAGEIVARPAVPLALFSGYWGMPEASLQAFRNLWFHTGDRGYIRPDGQLVFVDRIKDSIRRRGENISSFEVERAVEQHPAVLEAAAYAVPSQITEDDVMVAVVRRPGVSLEAETLFGFCRDTMPRFAVPRYLRFLEELPKTPSGRVQKFRLREAGVTADTHDREGA